MFEELEEYERETIKRILSVTEKLINSKLENLNIAHFVAHESLL